MIKKIKFSDFSQKYTGFNTYAESVNELKDALINVKTNESIKECEISQTLEPFHNFYTIRINNIWECDSMLKIL